MKQDKVLNMTEGNPMKLLAVFSLPMLIGNIFQQAYSLGVDVIAIWWTVGVTWTISAVFCDMRYFFWKRKLKD